MKKFFILMIILLPLSGLMTAQEESKIPAGISIAFRSGNAAGLSEYLNSTVEILLLDKEDFYSKSIAESILKDFFSRFHTREFTVRHQGAKNDAQYAIANLVTDKGSYRVYFLLKKVDGTPLIHQIRIEPGNE